FAENIGIVFQADLSAESILKEKGVIYHKIGEVTDSSTVVLKNGTDSFNFDIDHLRDVWFKTSYLLDKKQSGELKAKERFDNYKNQALNYFFPSHFDGKTPIVDASKPRPKAAVLREKGTNSERELAYALHLAGFDVKDVHMTDLTSG